MRKQGLNILINPLSATNKPVVVNNYGFKSPQIIETLINDLALARSHLWFALRLAMLITLCET